MTVEVGVDPGVMVDLVVDLGVVVVVDLVADLVVIVDLGEKLRVSCVCVCVRE